MSVFYVFFSLEIHCEPSTKTIKKFDKETTALHRNLECFSLNLGQIKSAEKSKKSTKFFYIGSLFVSKKLYVAVLIRKIGSSGGFRSTCWESTLINLSRIHSNKSMCVCD